MVQALGRRSVGCQKYRWKDEVAKNPKELNVPKWLDLVQGRKKWRILMSEAKIHDIVNKFYFCVIS